MGPRHAGSVRHDQYGPEDLYGQIGCNNSRMLFRKSIQQIDCEVAFRSCGARWPYWHS